VIRSFGICRALASSAVLFAGLALMPRAAHAQASDTAALDSLRIESSTCAHQLIDDAQSLLRVELKNTNLAGAGDSARLFLSCSEQVSLIRASINGHESSRQLDLAHTDPALQSRVIALAAAELLRDTANGESESAPAPPSPPPPAPIVEPLELEPPREPEPLGSSNHLLAFGTFENFGASFAPLAGGGLAFSHDIRHLAVGLDSTLASSDRNPSLGRVNIVAADLSLRLGYRFLNRALPGEIGVGHALGFARLSASTDATNVSAGTVNGLWAGPFVYGTLGATLAEPLYFEVAAQLGAVTFPVRGMVEHEKDVAVAGLWSRVNLGLGLNL
jgi:hypothetical protein